MKKQSFYNIVRWWLQCNTPYKTIVDVKEKKFEPSMFLAIQEHLENRKYDILNGKYFPNIANLRKINKDLDYKGAIDVVNIWLKKVSKSKFKTIKDLINQFNPSPTLLGYTERDFTTDLDGLFTHIKNFTKILGNNNDYLTGHIDLFFVFKDNTLIVADLKPKCDSQILASIPQIMAYGIMIRKILSKYGNIKAFKTLCIGFCKNSAWSFDPEQIKGEIIKFLKYEKRWSKREKTIESYKNISKLVSIL